MDIKELKSREDYEFECDITEEEYNVNNYFDEWGVAYIWLGNIGVEYNFCIQDDGSNCSAIYEMGFNEDTGYAETDTSAYIHYEIDFSKPNWKEELEDAMCRALIELHKL